MLYKIYQPHPALKEFVNNIVLIHAQFDSTTELPTVLVPPLPEKYLFFYPFDTPDIEYVNQPKKVVQPNSILVGRQHNWVRMSMKQNNLCLKVGFQPSGLYRLLGVPLNEYDIDGATDSRYAVDKDIVYVNEQLQEAVSYDLMVHIVEVFLLKKREQLRPKLPIDAVLTTIIQKGGLTTVDDIANTVSISFRQLERQFQQRIGMSPKFFTRLSRFAKAWGMKQGDSTLPWTTIAYQSGYYDQMHFIRDFKEFAGVPPSVLEAEFKDFSRLIPYQMLYE